MEANMAVEIRVPVLGESIVDAVVATWLKSEGDDVKQGETLVELETDKVNVEVSAEQSGVLQQILKHEGDVVIIGEALGIIGESVEVPPGAHPETPVKATQAGQQQAALTATDGQQPASPLARRIAAEYNVDLLQVKGHSP